MKPDSPLRHAKHVIRAGLLLAAGIVTLILGRSLFVPESWGQYGPYRGANVADQMARPVRHGGNEACAECHEEVVEEIASAGHHSLRCEGCHAPVASHAADGELLAEMPIRPALELCLLCHRSLEARPADFPQIEPREHIAENEGEFHEQACLDCHESHSPL